MTDNTRDLANRWFEEVWNRGRREAIAEMLAPDGVLHESGVDSVGPEGFYPFFDRMTSTFSDLQLTVHDIVAEGDRACVRWSCKAIHTGPGLGVPPTGRTIRVTGISICRIADGKLAEAWQNWDMLGMMEQIKPAGLTATYIAAPSPAE